MAFDSMWMHINKNIEKNVWFYNECDTQLKLSA